MSSSIIYIHTIFYSIKRHVLLAKCKWQPVHWNLYTTVSNHFPQSVLFLLDSFFSRSLFLFSLKFCWESKLEEFIFLSQSKLITIIEIYEMLLHASIIFHQFSISNSFKLYKNGTNFHLLFSAFFVRETKIPVQSMLSLHCLDL